MHNLIASRLNRLSRSGHSNCSSRSGRSPRALLGALLALCLLCSCAGAWAENRQITVSSNQAGLLLSGAVLEGAMYFLDDQLRMVRPGEAEATSLGAVPVLPFPATLVAMGDQLMRLDNATGQLARWDGTAFVEPLQLDWSALDNPSSPSFLMWPVWAEGALYGLIPPSSGGSGTEGFSLVRFDTATGARTDLPTRNIYQLAAYKPGQLLALSLDFLQYTGEGGGTVVVLDAATGGQTAELGTLGGLMDGGIAYDAATDTVFAVSGGQLASSQGGGAFVPGAYFNAPNPLNATFAGVVEGEYAILTGTDLHMTSLNAVASDTPPLRLKGFNIDDAMLQAFNREYPEVPVAKVDSLMTDTATIFNEFATADSQVDLYVLYSFQSLEALKEKGYLTDLSGIPGVAEAVAAMYPSVQDAVMQDGAVLALPASLMVNGAWSYNQALLDEVGLGMPATMLEYYEMLGKWEEEYAEDYPDYSLSRMLLPREQCVSMALQNYSLTYEQQDAPLKLDTPVFRAVMETIDALPYEANDLQAIQRGEAPMPSIPNTSPLIETAAADVFGRYGARDEEGRPAARIIPPLPFEEGVPTAVMALMPVYIINPNSPNREQAERFIAFAAQNMTAENRLLLCPDFNEPQRPAHYEEEVAEQRAELAELEASLTSAKEEDRRGIEEEIAEKKLLLEKREASDFDITAEAIADYRAVGEHLNLMMHSSVTSLDNPEATQELNNLLYRYMAGESTLDEALRELDKRFQMMFQERMSE